jgi:hypothetical protein
MPTREGTFYPVFPILDGKPLNLQWGELRSNTAETKAIVRNSVQELEDGVDELNALRALLGQSYGDLTFRNKFRFFYNGTTQEICAQKNDGTVDTPIWTDAWCIRHSDGQFQVVSQGGVQSNAGFYTNDDSLKSIGEVAESGSAADVSILNPTKIFFNADEGLEVQKITSGANKGQPEIRFTQPFGRAQTFTKAGREWQVGHNFGVKPVLVQVMDADDRVVIPDKADLSDPNTAYFYFNDVFSGSVIIASGGTGAASLVPRDPFYLVNRTSEQLAEGRILDPNADQVFDAKYFYVNVDLDEDRGGAHKRSLISLTNTAVGVDFTDGSNLYQSATEMNYNKLQFYLSGDLDGSPVLNFISSSTMDHNALAGLAGDDHNAYLPRSGGRAMTGALDLGNQDINNINRINSTIQGNVSVDQSFKAEAFYFKDGQNFFVDSNDLVLEGVTGTFRINEGLFWDSVNERLSTGNSETIVTVNGTPIGAKLNVHTEGVDDALGITEHRHSSVAGLGTYFAAVRSRGSEDNEVVVQNGLRLGTMAQTMNNVLKLI